MNAPFHLFAADFDGNGNIDPVMAYNYQGRLVPWEGRTKMNDQMPGIYRKYLNYNSYARSSLAEILGQEKLDQSLHFTDPGTLLPSGWKTREDGSSFMICPAEAQ
ncbi:MAG: hypothetical protein HC831_19775, partial [Chloroflexia bacterium]|nr:hypothetical protein [Chloroflexia bacterium]